MPKNYTDLNFPHRNLSSRTKKGIDQINDKYEKQKRHTDLAQTECKVHI